MIGLGSDKNQAALIVVFDKKMHVTHSTFSINGQTLLVRLGKLVIIKVHLACQAWRVSE